MVSDSNEKAIKEELGKVNNAFNRMPFGGGLFQYHDFERTDILTQVKTIQNNLEKLIIHLQGVSNDIRRKQDVINEYNDIQRAFKMFSARIKE